MPQRGRPKKTQHVVEKDIPETVIAEKVNSVYDLSVPELVQLLENQRQTTISMQQTIETMRDEKERLEKAMQSLTKTAEDVVRTMATFHTRRLDTVFTIMNSIQVLLEEPKFKEGE